MATKKKKPKVAVSNLSKIKAKKMWQEKFGEKGVISEETPYRKILLSILVFNLVLIGLLLALMKFLPPVIPLFYGMPEGEGQLSAKWFLILPPFISILILFANSLLSAQVSEVFFKKALIISAIILSVFSTITVIKIFFLVSRF